MDESSVQIICPFCGKLSNSEKYCTRCGVQFSKEIRSIAFTEETDPRSDYIGPLKTRTATRILIVAMIVLIVIMVVITEMQ